MKSLRVLDESSSGYSTLHKFCHPGLSVSIQDGLEDINPSLPCICPVTPR
jgi:hypothetical protein